MTKKDGNSNNDRALEKSNKLELAKEVNSSIAAHFNLSKAMQAGILYHRGHSAEDIGIIVDTSVGYVHNVMRDYRTKPKFRQRVLEKVAEFPEWFRTSRQAILPDLARAQNEAVELYLANPEKMIDKPQLAKQIAVQAGVKSEEESSPQLISIKSLTMIQNFLQQQQETAKQIEAEVIDIDTEEK